MARKRRAHAALSEHAADLVLADVRGQHVHGSAGKVTPSELTLVRLSAWSALRRSARDGVAGGKQVVIVDNRPGNRIGSHEENPNAVESAVAGAASARPWWQR